MKTPNKVVQRNYHIVAVNEKTGKKEYLTRTPENHNTACTLLKRFSHHPARRVQLQEVIAMDSKETTVLKAYCRFAGWQGGTIHQAMKDFKTRPMAEKDRFCGYLVDNFESIIDYQNVKWFMDQRLQSFV